MLLRKQGGKIMKASHLLKERRKKSSKAPGKVKKRCQEIIISIASGDLCQIKDFQVGELAKVYGKNFSYFSRNFRESENIHLGEYLRRMKILKGSILLTENPDITIKKLAELCGYINVSNFIHKFKGIVIVTPGKYKKWLSSTS